MITVVLVLTTFCEVVDEVGLGLELGQHLLRLHVLIERALLTARLWLLRRLLHVEVCHCNIESEFKINFQDQ